jgi:phosphatidylglycerophosphate synthase
VLVATSGSTLPVARLVDQLLRLGVASVAVIARGPVDAASAEVVRSPSLEEDLRLVAELARESGDGLLVGRGDVITHDSVLDALLTDPRVASGVLAAGETMMPGARGMRTDRGRVLSAGSPFHSVWAPNNAFLGFVKVSGGSVEVLAEAAEQLAALAPELERSASGDEDVPALLTVGLVRSGVHLNQSFLGKLFWARVATDDAVEPALREMASYDEDKVQLDSAVKPVDGFFTTFFVSPYSKYIARWAARRGLTPNVVTSVSMLVGVLAAAAFAVGTRAWLVVGAVLLQAAFTLDCVDGQLARYTRTFSKFGAWLDSMFDRGKEYVVFAGLAAGAARVGDPVWLLAGAALTLQVLRHAFDFSFAASEQKDMSEAPQRPLDDPWDGAGPRPAAGAGAVGRPAAAVGGLPATAAVGGPPAAAAAPAPAAATSAPGPAAPEPAAPPQPLATRILVSWRRLNRLPGLIWVKRMLPFPIGERFAAISITAALFSPRTTFIVLIVWGGVATAYTLAGRLLRSFR